MKKLVSEINRITVSTVLVFFYLFIIGLAYLIKKIFGHKTVKKTNLTNWIESKTDGFTDFESAY